jgi:1-acyl-sn-glycerol-3-phosphate acyltransferase
LSIEEQVSKITQEVEHISRSLAEKKSQMNAKLFKQEYKEISYGFVQTNMDYKRKQGMKLRYRIGMIIIYSLWKVLFGFRVKGRENIPDTGGLIIAPNHLSNFDPPLVGTAVWKRECFFLSKKDIFIINKFYSYAMEKFNAYPITIKKPTKSELKQIKTLVDKKLALIMFPEGTRSKVGHFVEFNEGVAWLALQCKAPIVPTLIANTNTPLVSQLIRKKRVVIKFGPPITVDFYSQFKDPHEARAEVTKELRRRIEQLVT